MSRHDETVSRTTTDITCRGRILHVFLALLIPVSAASAGEVLPELAERSELNGGLLLLPRFAESREVLELAEKTPFIVVACSPEETPVASLRKEAAARGLLASRIYVEQLPDCSSPLAENSASLLLVDDLVESDLTPARHKAWFGAISPRRGVAIVGNRKAEELDSRKLLDWASAKGAQVESLSVPGSTFVLIRKPAPKGSDVWTHRFHDPSNQRTSRDTTLKAPFGPAWYALPTNLGYRGDIIVSHGGRAYYIWANRLFYHSVSLICFDIHNGVKLWEQPFKWDKPRDRNRAGYYAGRSCMVALRDSLLLVDEDRLVILDGESGRELRSIEGPKPGGQIKWLGVEGDLVAVLAGDPDRYKVNTLQQIATNPFGTELAVYRLSDGALQWNRSEPGRVDERELAIFDSKLYAHTRGKWMACSDLATGEVLWRNRDPALLEKLGEELTGDFMSISYRILVATPEVLYFAAAIRANRVIMDRTNGKLLWTERVGKTRLSLNDIILGNALVKITDQWTKRTVDLKTKKPLDPIEVPRNGCGPPLATTHLIISQFGRVTTWSGETLRRPDLKAPCDLGVVIADGVAFSPPSACRCNVEIHGYRAFTSLPPRPAEDSLPQLCTGPAAKEPLAPSAPQAEWHCWRGDNRHSGCLSVKLPSSAPELKWHWKPVRPNPVPKLSSKYGAPHIDVPSHLPTQAVSAGGAAYFGDSQGVLRAISLKDGRELWNLPVGFKVIAPPALARGRVVVGALDGQVVCLDAKSGRLAWRYRVPRRRRRILWYGHLADTQPLIGGALIDGDTVYASAGFSTVDSIRVVALDLGSGKPKWTKDMPHDDPAGGTLGSLGAMTVAAGQLFIRSGGQVPASFDLESGELTAVPGASRAAPSRHGKDIAAVAEGWVLYGGRRVFSDFNRWKRENRGLTYSLCRTDRDIEGKPDLTVLGAELSMTSALMPVFDEELFITFSEYPARHAEPAIKAWQRTAFLEAAAAAPKPEGGTWERLKNSNAPFVFGRLTPGKGDLAGSELWTGKDHLAYAAALGSDALIVVHPKVGESRLGEIWQISALERADGTVRWTMPLPGRPVWDGPSLASDGSILIALWDGSMLCFRGG